MFMFYTIKTACQRFTTFVHVRFMLHFFLSFLFYYCFFFLLLFLKSKEAQNTFIIHYTGTVTDTDTQWKMVIDLFSLKYMEVRCAFITHSTFTQAAHKRAHTHTLSLTSINTDSHFVQFMTSI